MIDTQLRLRQPAAAAVSHQRERQRASPSRFSRRPVVPGLYHPSRPSQPSATSVRTPFPVFEAQSRWSRSAQPRPGSASVRHTPALLSDAVYSVLIPIPFSTYIQIPDLPTPAAASQLNSKLSRHNPSVEYVRVGESQPARPTHTHTKTTTLPPATAKRSKASAVYVTFASYLHNLGRRHELR